MNKLTIIEKPDLTDGRCKGISEIYDTARMGNMHSDALIRKIYFASSYFLLAEENEKVIGLLRAFGDDSIVTWLAEIAVHAAHQRQGIGKQLVQQFLARHEHTAVFTFCIKDRGQEEFFQSAGLSPKAIITGCSRAPQKKHAGSR